MRRASSTAMALLVLVSTLGVTGTFMGITAGTATATTGPTCSFPFTAVDATGTEVTVTEKPSRVVTLAPSAAQTMWEIGAREQVVGLSKYATYLDGADERTNVTGTGWSYVNVEQVIGLEPDLVLAPNVIPADTVAKLRDAGLTVYKFEAAASIDDVYAKTERTGSLVGACDGAAASVDRMHEQIATVEEAVSGGERPRVLYVTDGYAAGKGTFIDEIIKAAGGTNVAAQANITGYALISKETIIEQDPEWLILSSASPTVPDDPAYDETTAVEADQIVTVDANYVSQPAPRIVRPIAKLAKAFYPDAYAEAISTETPTETATPTQTATPSPTAKQAATETPSGGQPGFSAFASMVAIALLAGVAIRR